MKPVEKAPEPIPAEYLDQVFFEDCYYGLDRLPSGTVDCVITSPPYYALRDYNMDGQIGLEKTPAEYIERLVKVFTEVKRVLKDTGVMWIVIGDTYCNSGKGAANYPDNAKLWLQGTNRGTLSKATSFRYKSGYHTGELLGIPWRLAFALRDAGWRLRQDIIWHKPNPMPESVKSRCTRSHEYIFMFTKSNKYYFNSEALREPAVKGIVKGEFNHRSVKFLVPGHKQVQFRGGNVSDGMRNRRDVWTISVRPSIGDHHAAYPIDIPLTCAALSCCMGGVILDPFMGTGTTARAALMTGCHYIGFEINPDYEALIKANICVTKNLFNDI